MLINKYVNKYPVSEDQVARLMHTAEDEDEVALACQVIMHGVPFMDVENAILEGESLLHLYGRRFTCAALAAKPTLENGKISFRFTV